MGTLPYKPNLVVAAVVLIREKDSVLLVQQNIGKHLWGAPGGLLENGETIEQTAIREVCEETGLDVRIKRPIAFYSEPRQSALTITFEGLKLKIGKRLTMVHSNYKESKDKRFLVAHS